MKAQPSSEAGSLNPLLIPLILATVFMLSAIGFGVWAYMDRQKYKNDTDEIVAGEVAVAVERTKTEKDNEFIEREKEPLKEYKGPSDIGSVVMKFPKTWSTYLDLSEGESNFIFHPKAVLAGDEQAYALRVTVLDERYEDAVLEYDSNVQDGTASARVFKLPRVKGVTGVRIDGQLDENKNGSVVILPLRDKTIKIATENRDFVGDFNKIILPNFTFSP